MQDTGEQHTKTTDQGGTDGDRNPKIKVGVRHQNSPSDTKIEKKIYVTPGIGPGTFRVTARYSSSEQHNMIAIYHSTACNVVHPWTPLLGWGSPHNVFVRDTTPILTRNTDKTGMILRPANHPLLHRHMDDDGVPWDPEARSQTTCPKKRNRHLPDEKLSTTST